MRVSVVRNFTMIAVAVAIGMFADSPAVAATKTHVVVIEGMRFQPALLIVHRGDRVVWRNKDLFPHTAAAKGTFDSKDIAANGSWTYVANKVGALEYVCNYHPTMKGKLIVQ